MSRLISGPKRLIHAQYKILDGSYDVPGLTFAAPPRILDIGANIGAFTAWAVERWPGARVTCYEPQRKMFEYLLENTRSLERVDCINRAVNDHADTNARLYAGPNNHGECSLYLRDDAPNVFQEVVDVMSAEDLPPCDILKVDTEGAEVPILLTYPHLAQCSAVLVEWHRLEDRQRIHDILEPLGFQCFWEQTEKAIDRDMKFVHKRIGLGVQVHKVGELSREESGKVWTGTAWEDHGLGKFDERFVDKWPLLRKVEGRWVPHVHIFISTPVYDGTAHNTHLRSVVELSTMAIRAGVDVQFSWPRGDGIARCRNRQIAEFLATPATHLACIDADIGFQPQHLIDMVTSYCDVVFGAYPAKGIEWDKVISDVKSGKITTAEQAEKNAVRFVVNFRDEDVHAGVFPGVMFSDGRRFMRLKEGSTGFMVIRREVIEKMIAAYPERCYQDDYPGPTRGMPMYDLFHMGMDPTAPNELAIAQLKQTALAFCQGSSTSDALMQAAFSYATTHRALKTTPETLPRYLSEDYGFCRLWSMLGGDVHVYLNAQLSHVGQYVYSGSFGEQFTTTYQSEQSNGQATFQSAPADGGNSGQGPEGQEGHLARESANENGAGRPLEQSAVA